MFEADHFSFSDEMKDTKGDDSVQSDEEKWADRKSNLRSQSTPAPKAKRGRKKAAPKVVEERPPYKPNDQSIKLCATLGNVMWEFSRLLHGRRSLTEKETIKFGEALDPVLYKYLPVLNDWAVELNLAGTCWEIWNATAPVEAETPEGMKPTASSATVIE